MPEIRNAFCSSALGLTDAIMNGFALVNASDRTLNGWRNHHDVDLCSERGDRTRCASWCESLSDQTIRQSALRQAILSAMSGAADQKHSRIERSALFARSQTWLADSAGRRQCRKSALAKRLLENMDIRSDSR